MGGPGIQRFAYNGLTLQDSKGNVMAAAITPNWGKGRRLGGVGQKMEYIATFKPADKAAAEPARLVFTARHSVAVDVPFTLENIELK